MNGDIVGRDGMKMTVNEAIEALTSLQDKGYGELEIKSDGIVNDNVLDVNFILQGFYEDIGYVGMILEEEFDY